jgi:hypothetical protein
MITKRWLAAATILLALLIAGCPLPMHKMREAFAESLNKTTGQSLDELTCCPGRFLYRREPSETKAMANGNMLYVYGDYWGPNVKRIGTCDVFLEFAPDAAGGLQVVKATAEGDGCYRAY